MEIEPPSQLLNLFISIQPQQIVFAITITMLLLLSGIISASEVAFFSLSRKDLDSNKEDEQEKLEKISSLLNNKKSLLSTILILNNFINIAIVILLANAFSGLEFNDLYLTDDWVISGYILKLIFDLGFITFLILLFGEILPKIYAQNNPLSFALKTVSGMSFFNKILFPISKPLMSLTEIIERNIEKETFSVDQLNEALEITSEDESTTMEDQKILEGIVNFGNTFARQIMTPRVDMFTINKKENFTNVLNAIKENGYSRVPVFDENEDNICGVLFAKDLIKHIDKKEFDWNSVLKKPFFVPENKKLDDLLEDFQELKTHIAIVVDEYGGTSGLISLEDVIEEIVGDISDEFDDEDVHYTKIDENTYSFEGKTSLKDFYRVLDIEDDAVFEKSKGDAETLAGFVLENIHEFPKRKSQIEFNDYTFIIEAFDRKRIKRIKVLTPKTE